MSWVTRASSRAWTGVASSSDGTKLVAVVNNDYIYTSTDSGTTWTQRDPSGTSTAKNWSAVASSSDGTKIVATTNGDHIFVSTDSGATWTQRGSQAVWSAVASSSNGNVLVAVVYGGTRYVSTDGGVIWGSQGSTKYHTGVSISSNSAILAISSKLVSSNIGGIFVSTGSDTNGTNLGSQMDSKTKSDTHGGSISGNNLMWSGVAVSGDGTKIIGVVNGGYIYTAPYVTPTDGGTTETWAWTSRMTDETRAWSAVASSSDGVNLVATVNGGQIYTSTDSGVTWTARDSSRTWSAVAMSSTSQTRGYKMVATVNSGLIYTSTNSGVSCLLKNTKIKVLIDDVESDINIQNLTKHNYVKVVGGNYIKVAKILYNYLNLEQNPSNANIVRKIELNAINNTLPSKDLYMTKGHGVLVEQNKIVDLTNSKYFGYQTVISGLNKIICDHLTVTKNVDLDELKLKGLIESNSKIYYYHIVLETNDINERFGIYANDLIVESMSIHSSNNVNANEL